MKKVQVAVIGCGYLGKFHAEKYSQMEDVDLKWLVDLDRDALRLLGRKLNVPYSTDYKKIVGDVDAVSIVVPTSYHYKVAKYFLKAGRAVLLEKPVTERVQQAAELVEIAEKNKLILQVGHLERFNPAFSTVRDILNNPLFIEAQRLGTFSPRGTDVDVILDLMIHDIDIILSLVGSEVKEIRASGVPVISGKIDIANAMIQFKSGCVANITASRVSLERVRKMSIFQPDAYISIDYNNKKVNVVKKERGRGDFLEIVPKQYEVQSKDALFEEIGSFIKCVRKELPPVVSGRDGMKALATALDISRKIKTSHAFKQYLKGVSIV